jgi:hypothetical protein
MHDGVFEMHQGSHGDSLAKVDSVMSQAAVRFTLGHSGEACRGVGEARHLHHFVNEGKLAWKR